MSHSGTRNRLQQATSPYLLQHADNPVDWWPWCEEALSLAVSEDRPILLSIGYSACHWCHVMAHESFEDPRTAELMNRLFVNIKVDREERPDLDRIYQSAHQLLAQRGGGWPLTMFLTPDDRTPFFGGTYFPEEPRHGLPAFTQLITDVERAYREQGAAIRQQNQAVRDALAALNPDPGDHPEVEPDAAPLEIARRQLTESFDSSHGGFGPAPKFPHPVNLEFLLYRWAATANTRDPDQPALAMVLSTLRQMAEGGINDQLGGGFCRYSVDDRWTIPHFEKMLYDNASLLAVYCDAWQITADRLFRDTARATADWALREMQSPEGGFYSSLDADSQGEEGRFYVWTREQVGSLLTAPEYALFAARYGLDSGPNFEGRWHLHGHRTPQQLARSFKIDQDQVQEELASARRKLFEAREGRLRPARDDKVLTAWNALTIKGLARAARVLERSDYQEAAERALDFIRHHMWRDGRLLATYRNGQAALPAYLDDYAFLIDALLELLQTRWHGPDLSYAIELADVLLNRFQDPRQGGFFFTADDHETLIHRPKPLGDDATPSGNGVAARALLRLGHLLGETRYLEAAQRTLATAGSHIRQVPYAHASLLLALDEHLHPGQSVVVRSASSTLSAHWKNRLHRHFAPGRMAFAIPASAAELPGLLGGHRSTGEVVAYICAGTQCLAPVTDFTRFDTLLRAGEPAIGDQAK